MLKTYSFRLYPNEEQLTMINKTAGCVRFVYNRLLEYKSKAYQRRRESRSYNDCNAFLKKLKDVFPWLKEVNSQSLQMANRNLDTAYNNFFRDPKNIGYPKFKKKNNRKSFQCPQNVKVDIANQKLYLPKIGYVDCIFHRRPKGQIKTVTVVINPSGTVYAKVLTDTGIKESYPEPRETICENDIIGIDLGIKTLATCSDGSTFNNPKSFSLYKDKLAKAQKELSRKKKNSNNREKARIKVARIHEKIANKRKDAIEKATTEIARKNQVVISVENLNVKGMVRNHKLANALSDASFGMFIRRLEDKCKKQGKTVLKVDRFFPSSKLCHVCSYHNDELTLLDREWTCPICGAHHDRDFNASINIKQEALRILKIPMDGGEFTPVESIPVDDRTYVPKKHILVMKEEGRVPESTTQEAFCLRQESCHEF